MLDIVFRSCEFSDVHPERGSRFITTDKTTLIKKCFVSLVDSAVSAYFDTKLFVVDDHSSDTLLHYFEKVCYNKIPLEIISCEQKGYNFSAYKQFELCKTKGRKWIYSVEDDYLHYPNAILTLYEQAETFSNMFGTTIAIRPDDDLFTYSNNTSYAKKPCRIFLGKDRHWRTLHNTHNTFFTHVNVVNTYWELFSSLAKFYKVTTVNEDGTINTIWSDGVSKDGPVPLLSPIPSLAIHVSQNNAPYWLDYETLWESINIHGYS
jgi:glycosyltransferase involved in cell wall biosynthesis